MSTTAQTVKLADTVHNIVDGAIVTRLELAGRLDKDIKHKAIKIDRDSIYQMAQAYHQIQKVRIALMAQVREIKTAGGEDYQLLEFLYLQLHALEKQIIGALDRYTDLHPLMLWTKSQIGMGPVLTAGLFGLVDPLKSNHAGQLVKYAGLAPGDKRVRGEKLTYNPDLKDLCYLIGLSFTKQSFRENAYYGKQYLARKAYETAKNANGDYEAQAKGILATLKRKDTEVYKAAMQGKLSDSHIVRRAQRWTVKIFLNHWLYVAHTLLGRTPAKPYAIAILGHADEIPVPNLDKLQAYVTAAEKLQAKV